MAGLPEPYITQAGKNFLTGESLGRQQAIQDRELALQDQNRQTALNAGALAASGDLAGARNAFYKGGNFDQGMAIQNAIQKMSDETLQRASLMQDRMARLADTIKTPEEFETAKTRLRAMGLPVPQSLTFDQLPQLRAQALSVSDQMTIALKNRELAIKAAGGATPKPPAGYAYQRDSNGQLLADENGSPLLTFIPGGPADPAAAKTKFSGEQSNAANFANMMSEAEKNLTPFTQNPIGFFGTIRESFPEGVANLARSEDYQKYRQAAMQWVRAKLRKESGAAISSGEFDGEFKTYFPQYGDSQAVIDQKAKARIEAEKGMKAASGGAYDQLFGAPPSAKTAAPKTGATAKPSPSGGKSPFAQYPSAQQAPDGHWYVQQNGKYFRIDQ